MPAPPSQPAGGAGHAQTAAGASPWQVLRPSHGTSLPHTGQALTIRQVCMPPPVPQRVSPALHDSEQAGTSKLLSPPASGMTTTSAALASKADAPSCVASIRPTARSAARSTPAPALSPVARSLGKVPSRNESPATATWSVVAESATDMTGTSPASPLSTELSSSGRERQKPPWQENPGGQLDGCAALQAMVPSEKVG